MAVLRGVACTCTDTRTHSRRTKVTERSQCPGPGDLCRCHGKGLWKTTSRRAGTFPRHDRHVYNHNCEEH